MDAATPVACDNPEGECRWGRLRGYIPSSERWGVRAYHAGDGGSPAHVYWDSGNDAEDYFHWLVTGTTDFEIR